MTADYASPPVTEAVIGVEFAPLQLGLIRLASLYDVWRDGYPVATENQALAPSIAAGQPSPSVPFEFVPGVPPVRFWFETELGEWLIQVQDDRLILNWRRRDGLDYPGFDSIKQRFREHFDEFLDRLAAMEIQRPQVTAVEFTYFNRLKEVSNPSDFYSLFSSQPDPLPGELMMTRFEQVRNVRAKSVEASGQVSIASQPIVDEHGPGTLLVITTKFFPPPTPVAASTWQLVDEGHDIARATFASLTHEEVQRQEWGLR